MKKKYITLEERKKANAKLSREYRERRKTLNPDYYKEEAQKRKNRFENHIFVSSALYKTLSTAIKYDTSIPKILSIDEKIEIAIWSLIEFKNLNRQK